MYHIQYSLVQSRQIAPAPRERERERERLKDLRYSNCGPQPAANYIPGPKPTYLLHIHTRDRVGGRVNYDTANERNSRLGT